MKILVIAVLVYLLVSILIYFLQHYFFFRPEVLPTDFKYEYPFDFEEKTFEMEDGGSINSIHFKVPNSRGLVYYFKGNSRSIKGWGKFASQFVGNGFDFFVMDYRGFGKSKGKRTEQKLYNDSQHIYRHLQKSYPEKQIIIYGRSLGSGIAARIASWNNPAMLILDSPYYSFFENVKRWAFMLPLKLILRYKIRTDQFLKNIEIPVYLIHGSRDRLIPISHSHKLVALNEEFALTEIAGAGHNNLPDYPEFHEFIYQRLNESSLKPEISKAV